MQFPSTQAPLLMHRTPRQTSLVQAKEADKEITTKIKSMRR
jgi:hypothetical protein